MASLSFFNKFLSKINEFIQKVDLKKEHYCNLFALFNVYNNSESGL